MNLGQSWKTVMIQFACASPSPNLHRITNTTTALLTFYVQTWDEYHTKTLTLGVISGPVEGILTLCAVYAFTSYIGGGSFWQRSMLETLGVPHSAFIPKTVYELPWNEWYMVYGGIILVFNTIQRYSSPSPPYLPSL